MSCNTAAGPFLKKLQDLYEIIQRLRPSSPPDDFNAFAEYFTENCTVYLKSMNMHRMPGISRVEAIDDMKAVLEKVHIEERQVLNFSLTSDGRTLFCETKQRVNVMGEILDPFFETEVVTFDENMLIQQLKIYSCWSPIVDIVQQKTGKGPYAEGERREQFESEVKQMAMAKIRKREERLKSQEVGTFQNNVGANCCN